MYCICLSHSVQYDLTHVFAGFCLPVPIIS